MQPSHYDLELKPDLDAFTFDGVCKIQITVTEPVRVIKLHTKELYIKKASVASAAGAALGGKLKSLSFELADDICALEFTEDIPPTAGAAAEAR